jgi:N-acetylneuraminic acid mutarotase
MKSRPIIIVLLLLSLVEFAHRSNAQGTAFTYQGELSDTGGPLNGYHDLRFTLYDALTLGNQIGSPALANNVQVNGGLFTATINAANEFGPTAFNGAARWLEIAVRASSGGPFTILTPRQPLTPSPYAIFAGGVNAAGISGTIPAADIGNGTITSNMLAAGAAAANLNAQSQSAVPSGGMVLSSNYNDSNLLNASYVKVGKVDLGDFWEQRAGGTPPATRDYHTAVWTGCEMIVWGGNNGANLNNGGRYNPAANSWTAVTAAGAPAGRYHHTAVWTGCEMIVWGGYNGSSSLNDGGRYNPAANSWTAATTAGAPAGRYHHTAVWTGSEMIVWGGQNLISYFNDGGRYNPAGNSWTAVTTTGAPAARFFHITVWTGSEMIVWGGYGGSYFNDGGRYNPAGDSWTAVTTTGAPAARGIDAAVVWTGSEMIVWGGGGNGGPDRNDGGRYNPGANSWTAVTTTGAPSARNGHTAVWTGCEMIVWGGAESINGSFSYFNDGGRYNPAANSWTAVTTAGAPAARTVHTAVWTGSEMIVWGGYNVNGSISLSDTFSYHPARTLYLYQRL